MAPNRVATTAHGWDRAETRDEVDGTAAGMVTGRAVGGTWGLAWASAVPQGTGRNPGPSGRPNGKTGIWNNLLPGNLKQLMSNGGRP